MDCESLTEEEIREAAQELTLLQTSALSGAAFGTTFGRPPTATPPLASATPFQTSPPFSSFSNGRLSQQTPLEPLQETPNKFPRHETQTPGSADGSSAPQARGPVRGLEPEHLLGSLCGHSSTSVDHSVAAVATQWNKEQKEAPSKVKAPLRVIMFRCFVQEWRHALERLGSDPNFRAEAVRLEILSESGQLPYLRWNSQTMRAEVVADKSPLTVDEVIQMLKELTALSIADGTITRFHPTRGISDYMMGPTVTFRLELGLRGVKTFRFWQILEMLSASSALRLVASSLRRERMARSPLQHALHQP